MKQVEEVKPMKLMRLARPADPAGEDAGPVILRGPWPGEAERREATRLLRECGNIDAVYGLRGGDAVLLAAREEVSREAIA